MPRDTGKSPASGAGVRTVRADLHAEVLVLGAGPGGYTAAFRAADLGKEVVLVERYPVLGGVCLNVGCIPSKALLHTAQVIHEAKAMAAAGIGFSKPELDLDKIRAWKDDITGTLTRGLSTLAKQRGVRVLQGSGKFISDKGLRVENGAGGRVVSFEHAVIAAGSRAARIPGFPYDDPRVMDSTDALNLDEIPARLLVIGGGIIGLEMATIYHAYGAAITVVELMDQIIPGCDKDLVRPLFQRIKKQYESIHLKTKVSRIEARSDGLKVSFEGGGAPPSDVFDRVLVAVGRRPNSDRIGAEAAGVKVDAAGFIPVDDKQRTNVSRIHAIGDIVGNPMLAHKASHEGKVAAEVIAGLPSAFQALTIPSVAYTDPEVAWMGMSESEAKERGIEYDTATFPWLASGRSLSIGRKEGLTKLICDKKSGRLLGAGIVGTNAGELISEAVMALEMGADAEDIGLVIHPHPTLSETLYFAAEMVTGTVTDLYLKKPGGRGGEKSGG